MTEDEADRLLKLADRLHEQVATKYMDSKSIGTKEWRELGSMLDLLHPLGFERNTGKPRD